MITLEGAKKIVIALGAIILVLLGILLFAPSAKSPAAPASPAGGSAQPMISGDGHLQVFVPAANALVSSPLTVSGAITGGGWFFEAVFPVKILDGDGTVLGQAPAQAGGEPGSWMSTGTVPFLDTITFKTPKFPAGMVLFEKNNPSGLPQNDGALRLPVRFK